jgi:hypothetical protein
MTKIKGVKNWYCSLEMKEKFGMRPLAATSQWMFIVDSGWALDGCCYFLVGSGWPLIFPGRLWMVAVISWWALDGY